MNRSTRPTISASTRPATRRLAIARPGPRAHRAYLMIDVVFGIGLVSVLSVVLFSALGRGARLSRRLVNQRSAVRLAEAALIELQSGQPPTPRDGERIVVKRAPGGGNVAGHAWVCVSARVGGASARLVGLAPTGAGLDQALAGAGAGRERPEPKETP